MRIVSYSLADVSAGWGIPKDPYEINDLYVRGNYTITWTTTGAGIFSVNLHDVSQRVFADETPYHLITIKVNGETVKSDTNRLVETTDFSAHIRIKEPSTIQLVFSGDEDALTFITRLNSFITSDDGYVATTTPAPDVSDETPPLPKDADYEDWVKENGIFVSQIKYSGGCGPYSIGLNPTGDFALIQDSTQLWFIGDKSTPAKYAAQIVVTGTNDQHVETIDFEILDCSSSIAPCFSDQVVDLDIPVPEIQNLEPIACIEGNEEEVAWKVLLRSHWGNPYYVDHRWTWDEERVYPFFAQNGIDGEHWTELVKKGFKFYVHVRHRSKETGAVSPWVYQEGNNKDPEICEQLPTLPELPENPPVDPDAPQDCPPVFPPPDVPEDPDPDNPDNPQPPTGPNPDPDPCVGAGCGGGGGGGGGGDPDNPCCNNPPGWPPGSPPPGGCVGEGCEPGSDPPTPGDPGGGGPGGPDGPGQPPVLPPSPPSVCGGDITPVLYRLDAEWLENVDDNHPSSATVLVFVKDKGSQDDQKYCSVFGPPLTIIRRYDVSEPFPIALEFIGGGCPDCLDVCVVHSEGGGALVKWKLLNQSILTGDDPEAEQEIVAQGTEVSSFGNTCQPCDVNNFSAYIQSKLPDYEYEEDGITYRFRTSAAAGGFYQSSSEYIGWRRALASNEFQVSVEQEAKYTQDGSRKRYRRKVYVLRCTNGIIEDVTDEVIACEVMNHRAWSNGFSNWMYDEDHTIYSTSTYEQVRGSTWPSTADAPSYDKDITPFRTGWTFDGELCKTCCEQPNPNATVRQADGIRPAASNNPGLPQSAGGSDPIRFNNIGCFGNQSVDCNYQGSTLSYFPDGAANMDYTDGQASFGGPCARIAYTWTIKDNQTGWTIKQVAEDAGDGTDFLNRLTYTNTPDTLRICQAGDHGSTSYSAYATTSDQLNLEVNNDVDGFNCNGGDTQAYILCPPAPNRCDKYVSIKDDTWSLNVTIGPWHGFDDGTNFADGRFTFTAEPVPIGGEDAGNPLP